MKTLIIAIAIALLAGKAQGQTGVRAGWNYTDIKGISADGNVGFHAGLYHKVNFLGLLAIEPGIQYSQKGGEINGVDGTVKDRLHYIDVPLIARLGILPFINIFAGPQASVLLGRNYRGTAEVSSLDELTVFDMGGVVGLGIKLPLGFNVQGSYDFGFSDLNYNEMDTKNQVFKLSIGKNF